MRFSVDPWDPSYGTSLDTELGASTAEVDVEVELPAAGWRALDPRPEASAPETVLFVDGVRRIDAQVWVDESGGTASPALCASYAAGVLCCCPTGGAHLLGAHVRRGLFSTAPAVAVADIVTGAGTYVATHTAALPDAPPMQTLSLALQRSLAATELLAAVGSRDGPGGSADDLVVLDGPLPRQPLPRAIGFIKSHRDTYLPTALGGIVATLGAGQRTPVFRLCRSLGRPWERYTWYLRLPSTGRAPWAGVVRVECAAGIDTGAAGTGTGMDAEQAVALAAISQVTLPRYASTEYKDSRAPQNLYPIGGLERALRRRLGEPAWVYRALRRAAA
jgi:hypothetical protein